VSGPVVGILTYPLGEDLGHGALRRRTLRRGYRRALFAKANPRSPDYMRRLFARHYPDGRIESELPSGDIGTIVLLYPDANGLGFGRLERTLPRNIPVRVLNGRRRDFVFDGRTRRALFVRRALERSMVVDVLGLSIAALVSPLLVLVDVARGRR
jgi:hypothetical protein